MAMKLNRFAIYCVGLLTGTGIAVGVVSHATDSAIPYSFRDGEVISADTMNDLFSRLQNVVVGFSSESELNGAWNCTTYDADISAGNNISSSPSGAGARNFSADSASGLFAMNQVWTFSSNGTALNTTTNSKLGGIQQNITGGCPSVSSINYNAKIIQSALMLSVVANSCAAGNGWVLKLTKNSPYQFHTTTGSTFVSCVAINQPPNIPNGLAAVVIANGVSLTWTDTSNGSATGFTVLKKVGGSYSSIASVSSGTNSYTDVSGTLGSMYRVQANKASNNLSSLPSAAAIAQ